MTVEIVKLSPGEWEVLKKVEDGFYPDPTDSSAIVGIDTEGNIIGRVFLVKPWHVEGLWIERAYRNRTVMYQLVRTAENEAVDKGLTQLLAFAKDEFMADYIERLGYAKLPLTVWSKDLCQQH